MPPIRVALIGLSASAKTSWAAEGHLPYLLSERGRKSYTLVALCNTSVAAAQASIKHFNLDPSIKTYGSPEDLANDPEVDLVVVNTRVDLHHVAMPSIKAGKDVFIEWPLAENLAAAENLAELARESGSRTIIGLQGRYAPPVVKVCELLASGAIGKVVSSDVRALRAVFDPRGLPETLEYFTDIKIGGNLISVVFGHVMDFIHATLGEYGEFDSRAQIQKPTVTLLSGGYGSFSDVNSRTVTSNVPDMVGMVGTLPESTYVQRDATLSVNFRMEPAPFPGEPAFVWTIYGETGDLKITSPAGAYLHTDSYGEPITIEVFDHKSGTVTQHEWNWPEWQKELPVRGRNSAQVYECFAKDEKFPTFESAVLRHKQVEKVLIEFLP